MRKVEKGFIGYLVLQDSLLMLAGLYLATLLRFPATGQPLLLNGFDGHLTYYKLAWFVLPVWLAGFSLQALYGRDDLLWPGGQLGRIVNGITGGMIAVIVGSYALKMPGISRAWMLISWALTILLVFFGRLLFRSVLSWLRKRGLVVSRVLVVGGGGEANRLLKRMKYRSSGLIPVGYAARTPQPAVVNEAPFLGTPSRLVGVIKKNHVDAVLLAASDIGEEEIAGILRSLHGLPVDVFLSSGLFGVLKSRVVLRDIGGVPVTAIKPVGLRRSDALLKRVFDTAGALSLLTVLSPLLLCLATIVKATSKGPVFFRQQRIGKDRRLFTMFKFRSMHVDADSSAHRDMVAGQIAYDGASEERLSAGAYKTGADPRITPVGRWIRKYSLDELPQLLNVVLGEMSLVGPRPPISYEVAMYEQWMKKRLEITPGMTGWWQVSGRADLSYREMVKMDLFYIENWSLRLDLTILLKTLRVVLLPRGAY